MATHSRIAPTLATVRLVFLLLWLALPTVTPAGDDKNREDERRNYMRNVSVYDFEPRGTSLASRDQNGDKWPDFWAVRIGKGYSQSQGELARIRKDVKESRPGIDPGSTGHVLRIRFDGNRVALETRVPRVIDPNLAYEVSGFMRRERLPNSIVRIGIIWLYVEAGRETQVGQIDYIDGKNDGVGVGQIDWTEKAIQKRINDLPTDLASGRAPNRVRILCEILPNPAAAAHDRFGVAWFDDITIRSRPKLRIKPVFREISPAEMHAAPALPVRIDYLGLVDNIPDPENKNRQRGKWYERTVEILDMYGEPPKGLNGQRLALEYEQRKAVKPEVRRRADETILLPLQQYGVYYIKVTLLGLNGLRLAETTQVIGLSPRLSRAHEANRADAAPPFGIPIGAPPLTFLRRPDALTQLLARTGVRLFKIDAWPGDEDRTVRQDYYRQLDRELRRARSQLTARFTGVIAATPPPFRGKPMRHSMKESAKELAKYLSETVDILSPHIEYWQWGKDDDPGFSDPFDAQSIQDVQASQRKRTGETPQVLPILIRKNQAVRPPQTVARVSSLYVHPDTRIPAMLKELVRLVPRQFSRLRRKNIYAASEFLRLAPLIDPDAEEDAQPETTSTRPGRETWLSLGVLPVARHTRDVRLERRQLMDLARKAIIAKALGFPRIYLGSLSGGENSLIAHDRDGKPVDRPAFQAVRVLEAHLSGATYIGSFQFGDEFPNYVFRQSGEGQDASEVIVAVWYRGRQRKHKPLDIGIRGGSPLYIIDLAGNRRAVDPRQQDRLPIRATPQFITRIPLALALTRMSMRIADDPPLSARNVLQPQRLNITNYYPDQLPGQVSHRYAGRKVRGQLLQETNWTVRPGSRNFSLPRPKAKGEHPRRFVEYQVKPAPETVMGDARFAKATDQTGLVWPTAGGISGEKFVRIQVDLNIGQAAQLILFRRTRLTSDLDVRLQRIAPSPNDRGKVVFMLQVRWRPRGTDSRQGSLTLTPHYRKAGDLKQPLAKITISPTAEKDLTGEFTTRKIVIPAGRPGTKTEIGLSEDGGSRFYNIDVTNVMQVNTE